MGPEATIDALGYGETIDDRRGPGLAPPGRAHPRLGAGPGRALGARSGSCRATTRSRPTRRVPPFEPVRCHTFITESTFGLPIYRWPAQSAVFDGINAWWRANQERGRGEPAVRVRAGQGAATAGRSRPDDRADLHPRGRRDAEPGLSRGGCPLPDDDLRRTMPDGHRLGGALIVGAAVGPRHALDAQVRPGLDRRSPRAGCGSEAPRRRRSVDRGFVLSDHADWPGLLGAIEATGAEQVLADARLYGRRRPLSARAGHRRRDASPRRYEGERTTTARGGRGRRRDRRREFAARIE